MFDDVADLGSLDGTAPKLAAARRAGRLVFRMMISAAAAPGARSLDAGTPNSDTPNVATLHAIRASGLVALAALPVLLAVSLVVGKVVAVPAALFVPLLMVGGLAGRGRRAAAFATAAPVCAVAAGLLLIARPGLEAVQPVGVNFALLAAFAAVPLGWFRYGARSGAKRGAGGGARGVAEAIAAVEACSPDCAAIGIDGDMVCVAATRAALQAFDRQASELIGRDVISLTALFGRPALIKALASAGRAGDEVATTLEMAAAPEWEDAARVFSARLQPLDGHGVIMVVEPAGADGRRYADLAGRNGRDLPSRIDRARFGAEPADQGCDAAVGDVAAGASRPDRLAA